MGEDCETRRGKSLSPIKQMLITGKNDFSCTTYGQDRRRNWKANSEERVYRIRSTLPRVIQRGDHKSPRVGRMRVSEEERGQEVVGDWEDQS